MAEQTSAKDLIGVIRKSPSLMITAGVVFVFILIYVYERSKNASAATTAATQPGQYSPATGTYTYVEELPGTTGAAPVPGPQGPAGPTGPQGPAGPAAPVPIVKKPALPVSPVVKANRPIATSSAKYYTVTKWPAPGSSLWSISQLTHVPLATIEKLNPTIKNPNLIYPNQKVRYA